jgi:diketogulonate reductase-like aldo/keto reductase
MGQLHKVVDQLTNNSVVLDNKINSIGISKVKMPSIKQFSREKAKFKRFLTQIKLKIRHKGQKLPIVADQVAYIGLFLAGRALKWFKPYLIEYKANSLTTRSNKVRYMFLI